MLKHSKYAPKKSPKPDKHKPISASNMPIRGQLPHKEEFSSWYELNARKDEIIKTSTKMLWYRDNGKWYLEWE
jgi:hypothetical protein